MKHKKNPQDGSMFVKFTQVIFGDMFKFKVNEKSPESLRRMKERFNNKPFLYRAKIHLSTWWWFKFRTIIWYLAFCKSERYWRWMDKIEKISQPKIQVK